MNKTAFIEELTSRSGYSLEECTLLNDVLENHFLVGKKNREKIVEEIKNILNISFKEADQLYNISMSILTSEIKNKLKHPFQSKD